MDLFKHFPRLAAAIAFAATASTAVFIGSATHAGVPATGILSAAPQAADAAVSIGVGINVGGPYRYNRWAYRSGSWVRFGYGYAAAPGYAGGYYVGYQPPVYAPAYYGWGDRPYGYYHPYYGNYGYRPYGWRPTYGYRGGYGYHGGYGYGGGYHGYGYRR